MDASEILKRIRKIEITTRNAVSELFSGEYHSMFKGQGLEFSEVREYQTGDGFREIDWNVSARMGHPYIKKFEETRELNVMLVIDASASTLFGTKNQLKSEYIAELAGVLSFSALSNNDKVGLLLFSDTVEKYIPPQKGKKAALRILREILYSEPESGGTDIAKALSYVSRVQKKRAIVFVISDFGDDGFSTPLKLLAKKHDVVAMRVLDRAETSLPDAGLLCLKDPEGDGYLYVDTSSKRVRSDFSRLAKEKEEALAASFKKVRVDLLTLYTDKPYTVELMKFFKARIRRKSNG